MTHKETHFYGRLALCRGLFLGVLLAVPVVSGSQVAAQEAEHICPADKTRNSGKLLPVKGYVDMPYLVLLPSGDIGMTLTNSTGKEGSTDQHVLWLVSQDGGRNWKRRSVIEPPDGPEASWAMPFVFDDALFVVYVYNKRNRRHWPFSDAEGARSRVDMVGDIVIRRSRDEGRSWEERKTIRVRKTKIDERNGFGGQDRVVWISGRPIKIGSYLYFGISKGGVSLKGDILPDTEAFLLRSSRPGDTESWELLPHGQKGFSLGNTSGVNEEPTVVNLRDGRLMVTARTTEGKILQLVSSDDGTTWNQDWARYANGRPLENPRAEPPVFLTAGGEVLLWFHNNGHRSFGNRNPVYLSCLDQSDPARLRWSTPSMLMCDHRSEVRISYPSFLFLDDAVLIAETSKNEARVHRLPLTKFCPPTR